MRRREIVPADVPCVNCSQFLGAINALAARMGEMGKFRYECGFCGTELGVKWDNTELVDDDTDQKAAMLGVQYAAYAAQAPQTIMSKAITNP